MLAVLDTFSARDFVNKIISFLKWGDIEVCMYRNMKGSSLTMNISSKFKEKSAFIELWQNWSSLP